MRILWAVLRVIVGIAIIVAITAQLVSSIGFWHRHGIENVTVNVVNFFSFFTIDANVLSAVVLLIGAALLFVRTGRDPHWFTVTRASAATYMIVTGIVYNLLLRGIALPQGTTLEWSNEILHVVAPVYLLLDWLFASGRTPLAWKSIWTILAFPIVWVVYTMIRGPLTADLVFKRNYWYPYPFLNPNTSPEGYFSVAFYIVLIAVVIGLTAAGVVWVSRRWSHLLPSGTRAAAL